MEAMGLPYVPFTFPTITVQQNAKRGGVNLSTSEVDRIWAAYKVATLNEGIAPFAHDAGGRNLPIIQYLEKATSLSRMKIVAWLNATEQTVNQGWGFRWIDPKAAAEAEKGSISLNPIETLKTVTKGAGEAVSNFLKPSAEPLTNLIKWTAVAAASGAVIYGLWTLAPVLGLRKRKKKG